MINMLLKITQVFFEWYKTYMWEIGKLTGDKCWQTCATFQSFPMYFFRKLATSQWYLSARPESRQTLRFGCRLVLQQLEWRWHLCRHDSTLGVSPWNFWQAESPNPRVETGLELPAGSNFQLTFMSLSLGKWLQLAAKKWFSRISPKKDWKKTLLVIPMFFLDLVWEIPIISSQRFLVSKASCTSTASMRSGWNPGKKLSQLLPFMAFGKFSRHVLYWNKKGAGFSMKISDHEFSQTKLGSVNALISNGKNKDLSLKTWSPCESLDLSVFLRTIIWVNDWVLSSQQLGQ